MLPRDRFVLHRSVAVRWWLHHLPGATDAHRLLFEHIAAGAIELFIPTGMEITVLEDVAADIAGTPLDADLARLPADDILRQFRLLAVSPFVTMTPVESLARFALSMAISQELPFMAALAVVLAGFENIPLLVADETARRTLLTAAANRPGLRLVWLPDYMNEQPEQASTR